MRCFIAPERRNSMSFESLFLNYGWLVLLGVFVLCYCFLFPMMATCVENSRAVRRRAIVEADATVICINREESPVNVNTRQRTSDIPVLTVHDLSEMEEAKQSHHESDICRSLATDEDEGEEGEDSHNFRERNRERKIVCRKGEVELVEAHCVDSCTSNQHQSHCGSPPSGTSEVQVVSSFIVEEAVDAATPRLQTLRTAGVVSLRSAP